MGARRSRVLVLVLAFVLSAVALVAGPFGQRAEAVNAWDFQAGNIISDAIFFNSGTMTEGQVQSFLNSKVSSCRSGYTCLKDYRQDTYTIPATPMCATYQGAAGESAARIIVKVAQTCGINPQVLVVMLQKEQGLVTDTWPTTGQYRSAMGAGCPDTAACDANYYGFFNQVHYGAYLLKRYTQPRGTGYGTDYSSRFDLSYPVGQTSYIQFNPNSTCGGKNVYIANQATHVLYVYTPYTPTDAALAAGYAAANNCSAYGNRNFFLYFSDWFGSTQLEVGDRIRPAYDALGAQNGYLGWATTAMNCGLAGGGCYQGFQGGVIHWSPATGAHATDGAIMQAWQRSGWEGGPLGYPTTDATCGLANGGCFQGFQGGSIHWSAASGAHATDGAIEAKWRDLGWEGGVLGYPTGDASCAAAKPGCTQDFQGGTVAWSAATGAQTIDGAILAFWRTAGAGAGALGYPAQGPLCGLRGGACSQDFQTGAVVWTPAKGAQGVDGAIWRAWVSAGAGAGSLGYPTSPPAVSGAGTAQLFEGGEVRSNPATGAFAFTSAALTASYDALGGPAGYLGQPIGNTSCDPTGCTQSFKGGTVALKGGTSTGYALDGAMLGRWVTAGGPQGALGYPTGNPVCASGACKQAFENGSMIWSASSGAAALVQGPVAAEYTRLGGSASYLGFPTADTVAGLTSGGSRQQFQGGAIYASAAGPGFALDGAMLARYVAMGADGSALGYPTGSPVCANGGCVQRFEHGSMLWSGRTGAAAVIDGAVATEYQRLGGTASYLGWPTENTVFGLVAGGSRQQFAGGAVYAAPGAPGFALDGAILARYLGAGAESGSLGYPTSAPAKVASGPDQYRQTFERGTITWTAAAGAVVGP